MILFSILANGVYLSHPPKNEKWFSWFSNSVTFQSFPLWSLTEEDVLHWLKSSSKTTRKFICIFFKNRIYFMFLFLNIWIIHLMGFPGKCNPLMHHNFIMIQLLREEALGSMETFQCRSEKIPHEHEASTGALVNIRAESEQRNGLSPPSP